MRLSDAQKAKNKAANAVRRRAHAARYRLLRAAIEAAEAAPEVLEAKAEADAAHERSELAWRAREDHIARLRAQIAGLEQQIEDARNDRAAFKEREAEKAAWSRWSKLKDAKVAEAEAKFPDLTGPARWSAAAWVPPEKTQSAMDAAAAAAGNSVSA